MTKYLILFDGVCSLCAASVRFIIKRDLKARFQFASLQSKTGQAILLKYNLPTDNLRSLVLIKDEKCYQKSSAFLIIVRYLSGLWPLLQIFFLVPRGLRDFVYFCVSHNRYRLFENENICILPGDEIKSRFLE